MVQLKQVTAGMPAQGSLPKALSLTSWNMVVHMRQGTRRHGTGHTLTSTARKSLDPPDQRKH